MKCPWILLTACSLMSLLPPATSTAADHGFTRADLSYPVVENRFQALPLPVEVNFGAHISEPIKVFLINGRRECEKILGRATLYFPIFEHYLKVYDLPEMLKYLPIVESRLLPQAASPVGAGGLWQFMPGTAEMYRLQMTDYVDERFNPHRSTEAAVKMLSELYDQFGDWLLALAAYNCGPGRVQRAIRKEKCDNYWDIQHLLPWQTREYIPRFLAAVYVFHYYGLYGLQPQFPHPDLRYTRTVRVHRYLTFKQIARTCRVSESTLRDLNPGFLEGIIPYSRQGHALTLPARIMPLFRYHFSDRIRGGKPMAQRAGMPVVVPPDRYVVAAGDSLELIAKNYRCRIEDLVRWNNLGRPEILVNQELKLYPPGEISSPRFAWMMIT